MATLGKRESNLLVTKGVLLLLFGIAALVWPAPTFVVFATIFAVYVIVDGVLDMIRGMGGAGKQNLWFLTLILGIFEIVAGIYALEHPAITLGLLILVMGASFVVRGVVELVAMFDQSVPAGGKVLLGIFGVISILAGIAGLAHPREGGRFLSW